MARRRRFSRAFKRQAGGQEAPTGVYIARLTAQSAGQARLVTPVYPPQSIKACPEFGEGWCC